MNACSNGHESFLASTVMRTGVRPVWKSQNSEMEEFVGHDGKKKKKEELSRKV